MKPTIGRTVHFRGANADGSGGDVYAAIVTRVYTDDQVRKLDAGEDLVDLVTFGPNSIYFQHRVAFDGTATAGYGPLPGLWAWPSLVPA